MSSASPTLTADIAAAALEAAPYPFLLLSTELAMVEVNAAYLRTVGRTREELLGRNIFDTLPASPDDVNNEREVRASIERVIQTGKPDTIMALRYSLPRPTPEGSVSEERYWSVVNTPILDDQGRVKLILNNPIEVTEFCAPNKPAGSAQADHDFGLLTEGNILRRGQDLEESNRNLTEERARLRRIFEQAPGFTAILHGPQLIFEIVNESYYQLVGHRDLIGKPVREAFPELKGQVYFDLLDKVLASGEPFVGHEMSVQLQRLPSGPLSERFVDFVYQPLFAPDGAVYGVFVQGNDVTEEKQAREAVQHMAYHDPLTGLPNHTRLLEQLQDTIQAAKQQHRAFAVLHLDIGCYREINKVLGYRAGNQLLQQLAQGLAQFAKGDEALARVGESDFVLLLPRAGADHAIQVAQRLVTALRVPVEVAGLMVDPGASIGIALYPGHGTEAEALLRRASTAAQDASPGQGGYAIYTGGQEQEFARRLALMGDLRRAIEQNELLLYCQPKVNIASRHPCGAEALVRWQHPVHGMISPAEFIKLAEHAGLITPLTNWMLDAAFNQAYAWQETGLKQGLSVNLSAHDLYHPGLIDRIRGLFSTWGISPELIQFELTESALMKDPTAALATLSRLKKLGTRLFIDDFGTGYSSLSYLQQLPVDSVKIDQSFVMPMITSSDSATIVHSTIELGHNLELEVVAEGVESQAVWDRLAALGCDVAQGYLMSMPIPAAQFGDWESKWSRMSA